MTKRKKSRLKHRIVRAYNRTSHLYLVQVRLIHQGTPLDFPLLFDTGATHTGISRKSFEFLGINEIVDTRPTITATGETFLSYGFVDSFVLDRKVAFENLRVNILSDQFFEDFGKAGYRNIGGLLGGSLLCQLGFYMGNSVIDIFYEPKPISN